MQVEIPDGYRGQIQLQGLPMIAAIEGNIDPLLGAAVDQSLALWIFAYDSRHGILW